MSKLNRISVLIVIVLMFIYFITDNNTGASVPVLKLGYVDIKKVIDESEAKKKAIEELEREYKSKEEIFKKRDADLKKIEEELSKGGLVMDEKVKREKEEEYSKQQKALKRDIDDGNQELADREREKTKEILLEIENIIQNIGKEDRYTIIFDKNDRLGAILYASDEIDLTQEVIKRYNNQKRP
ncbi:MAG: OmpH family outer membrane protein [Nitrospinae bacterium]|nr:OmpH family outer membrane protein [Nitrospinota bacterium]